MEDNIDLEQIIKEALEAGTVVDAITNKPVKRPK